LRWVGYAESILEEENDRETWKEETRRETNPQIGRITLERVSKKLDRS
jgi:hypothetical protein